MRNRITTLPALLAMAVTLLLVPMSLTAQMTDPNSPDTVFIEDVEAFSGGSGVVPVYFSNDESLAGIEITLRYNSPDINIDSFSFEDSRLEGFAAAGWATRSDGISIYCIAYENLIPAGSGLLGTLHMGYLSTISPQVVTIDSLTIEDNQVMYSTLFSDAFARQFAPQFDGGTLTILAGGCCLGDRGNIDDSADDALDISDLIYLVDYMFTQGPAPVCTDEADLNSGNDGIIDISDLIYLVDYMFTEGPPPPPCY